MPAPTQLALSGPPRQRISKTAPILLYGLLEILRRRRVEIFPVQEVVNAGGEVQVFAKVSSEGSKVKRGERRHRASHQRLNPAAVLSVQTDEHSPAQQRLSEAQL